MPMRLRVCAVPLGLCLAAAVCAQESPLDAATMQKYSARVTAVNGQVSWLRDGQPWAISAGERIPPRQLITTGIDGYAHFEVAGGTSFDVLGDSRVVFRENAANEGDLLDVISGRVRVRLQPAVDQQQRVFSPIAIISTREQSVVAVAVDEDDMTRIDVLEGQVRVQHKVLPRNEPILVRAVDAILVQRDQPISHRMERGSLYRYTVKLWTIITLGHPNTRVAEPEEQNRFIAEARDWIQSASSDPPLQ